MRLSRRKILRCAGALALAPELFARQRQEVVKTPHLSFPTDAKDRLSVTSYPFRAYIDSPTNRGRKPDLPPLDLKDFASMVRDKFGIHNINPLSDHFHSTDRAYIDALQRAVSNAESHIVDLGLPGGAFYSPDAAVRQAGVDFGKRWIDIAAAVGSPSVRQHVKGKRSDPPNVDLASDTLMQLADYGGKQNIVVNLENDSPGAEDPFFLAAVIKRANHPYLRGLPDFGNSLIGHDAAYNERAVRAMLRHAFNMCHVKDTVQNENGQRYTVDLQRMFQLAKESGYKGYFSMECETQVSDPYSGTKRLAEETLKYLA